MRISLFPLVCLLAAAHAADPRPGDTRADAEAELGKPVAVRKLRTGELVAKYRRGLITYQGNTVLEVKLLSKAESEKREAQEQAEAQAAVVRVENAAREKAARVTAGNKARDELITSEAYKQLSAEVRSASLTSLAARHPDADLYLLRADLELVVAREAAARKQQADEAAFRQQAEVKLAAVEVKLAELRARLDQLTEVNTRLAERVVKAEADTVTLLNRVNVLDELVRTRVFPPAAVPPSSSSLKLSVGSSDPMRN